MLARKVIIEGGLAEDCPPVMLAGDNVAQLVKGLEFVYPAFKKKFYETSWSIMVRDSYSDDEQPLSEVMVGSGMDLGNYDEVHFVPNPDGGFFLAPLILAALSAIGSATAGAALAAGGGLAAIGTAGGFGLGAAFGAGAIATSLAVVGSAAIVGAMYGLSQAFQPSIPKIGNQSAASGGDQPSFLYNNPPNVSEQGNPIPLIYGYTRVGGTVISAALISAKVPYTKT
jgi:predicted phage tail protein